MGAGETEEPQPEQIMGLTEKPQLEPETRTTRGEPQPESGAAAAGGGSIGAGAAVQVLLEVRSGLCTGISLPCLVYDAVVVSPRGKGP